MKGEGFHRIKLFFNEAINARIVDVSSGAGLHHIMTKFQSIGSVDLTCNLVCLVFKVCKYRN